MIPAQPDESAPKSTNALARYKEQVENSSGNMGDLSPAIPESWRGKNGVRLVEDIPAAEWKASQLGFTVREIQLLRQAAHLPEKERHIQFNELMDKALAYGLTMKEIASLSES